MAQVESSPAENLAAVYHPYPEFALEGAGILERLEAHLGWLCANADYWLEHGQASLAMVNDAVMKTLDRARDCDEGAPPDPAALLAAGEALAEQWARA